MRTVSILETTSHFDSSSTTEPELARNLILWRFKWVRWVELEIVFAVGNSSLHWRDTSNYLSESTGREESPSSSHLSASLVNLQWRDQHILQQARNLCLLQLSWLEFQRSVRYHSHLPISSPSRNEGDALQWRRRHGMSIPHGPTVQSKTRNTCMHSENNLMFNRKSIY